MVKTITTNIDTHGNGEVIYISDIVKKALEESGLNEGIVTVFCPTSTASITTMEFEPGAVQDLQRLFNEIVNPERVYAHNELKGDGNGHSHARAALVGPSLTVPVVHKELKLGFYQQIVYIDFDNRSRNREIMMQFVGE